MAETGHARNIQHFQEMISFVGGYGATYDPSNPAILPAALQAILTAANVAMDLVMTTLAPNRVARTSRRDKFDGIRRLVTRVVNSFAVSAGASDEAIEIAKGYKRKIDGPTMIRPNQIRLSELFSVERVIASREPQTRGFKMSHTCNTV